MKISFTIIAAFLFPLLPNAQVFQIDKTPLSIDSLRKVLPSLHDSARVDCLIELDKSCMEAMNPIPFDSALLLAKQAYSEASAIKYIKGLGDACLLYGEIYSWYDTHIPEAEKYHREAIYWHEKIQNANGMGFGFRGLGCVLLWQGSLDESIKAFERSALHFRKAGNQVMLADLLDWFGHVYQFKGDLEKQFEYVKKGLREKKRINDNRGLVWSYFRLAQIYQTVEDFETSLNYFRQSIVQAQSQSIRYKNIYCAMGRQFMYMNNHDSSIYYFQEVLKIFPTDGETLMGLGSLYMQRKEYGKALDYLQKALITFKKGNDIALITWVLVDMGKSYTGLKQYAKALEYGRECLAMARRWVMKDPMWYAYEIHWNVYEALGQKDSAYFYYRKFVTLRDSLKDVRLKIQHLQKLALYKAELKEEQQQASINLLHKDNQIKQQRLEKEALLKKILTGSFIALVLLSIILFRNAALKRKNEKHRRELAENELQIQKLESERIKTGLQQQATELEMQALRAQMNPHFIFNCLSSINRFILKNESETASDYLTKFSRLIRMVLNNSNKPLIILEDELEMLRLYLDLERLRFKNSFDYSITFHNNFDAGSIFIPPLLLQPFAENAIWHGLMHKEGQGILDVAFELEKNVLNCHITDNGVGRKKAEALKSKSAEKQKSMGMRITAERLALFNKETEQTIFSVEDLEAAEGQPAGTRITLKIKYKESPGEFS